MTNHKFSTGSYKQQENRVRAPRPNPWTVCRRFGKLGECREPETCQDLACHDHWSDQHYERKRPRPMPVYEPLIVTPIPSRHKSGSAVAFIGKQLCFFEKEEPMPAFDVPIEVMITRVLYHRHPEGHEFAGHYDWTRILALVLRPVSNKYVLISHGGFECSGSMCRTTANIHAEDGSRGDDMRCITPGRSIIYEASNVNSGTTWKQQYTPLRPGKVWVERVKYEDQWSNFFRVEGVARVEDLMAARYVKV